MAHCKKKVAKCASRIFCSSISRTAFRITSILQTTLHFFRRWTPYLPLNKKKCLAS